MKVTKVLEYRINCDIDIPNTNTAGAEMMLQIQHEKMSCQHICLLNRDRGHK